VNVVEVFIYGTMRPLETVLRSRERRRKEKDRGMTLRYIVSNFTNVTMSPWYNYNMLTNF
jgi:hypothetical protein